MKVPAWAKRRQREGLGPARHQAISVFRFHRRSEPSIRLPLRGDRGSIFPVPHRQSRQIGRTQRGGFRNFWPHHGDFQEIRLKLHEEIVIAGSSVHPQFLESNSRIGLHGVKDVGDLVGDPLQSSAREMGCGGSSSKSGDGPSRVVPFRPWSTSSFCFFKDSLAQGMRFLAASLLRSATR